MQRSADPGADAARVASEDAPVGLPFLGEVNSPEELRALVSELMAEEGGPLGLVAETFALEEAPSSDPSTAVASNAQAPQPGGTAIQASFLDRPLQRSVVAGCVVPGVPPNVIGIAAHGQIGSSCIGTAYGCAAPFNIPGDGQADLVRRRIPFVPEIGEIKPASWLGRGLQAAAAAQLLGYLVAYEAAFPGSSPLPMSSWTFPGGRSS
jgi:hypothetical protein